ncbi:MAG: geranylgeranylglyceryl/heptaprenylglyceryl phosphate synthase [Bacteroidales bacterium]|nr:geranylgeranylglyceryl/heptaprenylglyceryl phosphate synthase [Bacteroidales bacterium]
MSIYSSVLEKKRNSQKQFVVLIDPDKIDKKNTEKLSRICQDAGVDFLFIGGSLLTDDSFNRCIEILKKNSNIPVVIFPGNAMQISSEADAILFLSLISGRNAEMLIGNHIISAPILKKSGIEVISTGYMIIESGKMTSVSYMSNTMPIPFDKIDIAVCTAMAGEMLGMKLIFMDAGSGALNPVSKRMIENVSKAVSIPLIVGGGINTPEKAMENCKAGADIIVVGNAIEKNGQLISEMALSIHSA